VASTANLIDACTVLYSHAMMIVLKRPLIIQGTGNGGVPQMEQMSICYI
jgi:hypothetical protein